MNVDKKTVKLQIWDTAGQERYRTITNAYYRGSDGILLCVDACNKKTFENIPDWLNEIEKYTDEEVKKILLVNKSDQEDRIEVTKDDLEQFKKEYGIDYLYTSAKSGKNVDQGFLQVTQELIQQKEEEMEDSEESRYSSQRQKYNEGTHLFNSNRSGASPEKGGGYNNCCN